MNRWVPPAVSLALALSGCSSGHHSRAVALSAWARSYLDAATVANARVAVAKARMASHDDLAAVEADLVSIAMAKEDFDVVLRSLRLPPTSAGDLRALLSADLALERALRAASAAVTPADLAARQPEVMQTGRAALAAADVVRRDLGLPPAP